MKKAIGLPFIKSLEQSLKDERPLIQVILGPRQVGKTTGVKQLLAKLDEESWRYFSADGPISKSPDWLLEKWYEAKSSPKVELIVVDEIQNIEGWAGTLKQVWDEEQESTHFLKVVVLGSSSLSLQKGLRESLAGRFLVHRVHHWSLQESREAYGLGLE
ncbi:AAA family ATPase, partial [Myxococcota bacterium]|nr:AAA family ATPase [Myxococcota bacterium]